MTDIVERLRADARLLRGDRVTPDCFPDLMDEAADIISELVGALDNAKWLLEGIKRAGWVANPSFGDDINLGLDRINVVAAKARGGAA